MINYTVLLTEIKTGHLAAELAPYLASGNDTAIADILNEQRGETVLREKFISARGVLNDYPDGPAAGATVLDKLESASANVPALKWVMSFLKGGGIDIASLATQGMLDQLVLGGALLEDEAIKLKGMGLSPGSRAEIVLGQTVSTNDVAKAVRNDDGSAK